MIDIVYKGHPKLMVTGDDDLWKVTMAVGGIVGVTTSASRVSMPLDTRLYELMQKRTGGLEVTDDVMEWYQGQIEKEQRRASILLLEDTELDHPHAPVLWPFQRVGARFISKLGSALLCDECGLGKTATAIVATEMVRWHRKMLVICPKSLRSWWAQEIEVWSKDDHDVIVLDSKTRDAQLQQYRYGWLIMNYELTYRMPGLQNVMWDWIICDEAHRMKNRKTKTFKSVKRIKSRRKVLMTGTPWGNDTAEIWSLLNMLNPRRYASYWRFFEMYVEYIENYFGRDITGARNPDLMRLELTTIMARRTKKEYLPQLPEKLYQTIPLRMDAEQEKLYRKTSEEYLIELEDGNEIEITSELAMIVRLRQILSFPGTFGEEYASLTSCKVEAVLEYISNTEEKVVVFTEFRATAQAIASIMDAQGVECALLMGGMDVDVAVGRFQKEEGCQVFVATRATGGTGLTLTASSTIIFVEKHWNPSQQQQAEDRVHRIGQEKKVHIISLVVPNTVDDLIEKALARKMAMTDAVMRQELRDILAAWSA